MSSARSSSYSLPARGVLITVCLFLGACDYWDYDIDGHWSLCAIDDPNQMKLCRNLKSGDYLGASEPVMVAWGTNGTHISLRRCLDGQEEYYAFDSVAAKAGPQYPELDPVTREDYEELIRSNPEEWPELEEHISALEYRHCPEAGNH